ncbi:MAG TPA: hypothetical protein PLS31_11175 [Candidatus Sumerlaeota bacterium]|nr:MAG: hypothetical protein BWY12_01950 [candidate division BRC1 bacterium ADurb.Bin183]HQH12976.1 hypothetical protein [Candidatus Sumerlaeota bacterium]
MGDILKKTIILLILMVEGFVYSAPFIDRVVSVQFGENNDPLYADSSKVLGPPRAYDSQGLGGSEDVLNIGVGGSVIVEFIENVIYDGEGVDFVIFENPFYIGGDFDRVYLEPAYVFVSSDGDNFTSFPVNYLPQNPPLSTGDDNPDHYIGFAGIRPVFSNPENGINPLDPSVSGGDAFDLSDIKDDAAKKGIDLQNIRFIKIQDVRRRVDVDTDGDVIPGTTNPLVNGFDLDAIAVINAKKPAVKSSAQKNWNLYE